MTLKDLKKVVDQAVENAGDTDPKVEIWIGSKKAYDVGTVSQCKLIPDVVITVGEKLYDSHQPGPDS